MLNWWAALDIRGRFFFWSVVCFVAAGIVYFVSGGGIAGKPLIGGIICLVIGAFCPKDDSTKI